MQVFGRLTIDTTVAISAIATVSISGGGGAFLGVASVGDVDGDGINDFAAEAS